MTDLKISAAIETEWARAMYLALMQAPDQPIYDELVREYGRPVLVVAHG